MKFIQKLLHRFGYKKYNCTNCKKNSCLNVKDADGIVAGYCRKCGHPIWYAILLLILFSSCKTYNVYIIDPPVTTVSKSRLKENRFISSFRAADSSFIDMCKLRKASKEAVIKTNEQLKSRMDNF